MVITNLFWLLFAFIYQSDVDTAGVVMGTNLMHLFTLWTLDVTLDREPTSNSGAGSAVMCQDSPETLAATVKGVEGREGAEVDSVNSRGWISFWFPATGDLDAGKWGSWGTCQQTRGSAEQCFTPLFWKKETDTHDSYNSYHVNKRVTKGHSFLKLLDI